jgi:hypothetical protein
MIVLQERLNISDADRRYLVSFSVDFNGVRDHDRLVALGRFASEGWQLLAEGGPVLVHDSEGNECIAYIEGRRGKDLFDLRLDWETWVPSDQPKFRMTSSGVPAATATPVPTELHG